MRDRVLFVDDDANLLSGLRRQFRRRYDMQVALGGDEALRLIAQEGPFAVVVADMRMPGMTGIELLEQLKRRHPDTVRMMLTGNADQQTAAEAVNQGAIFRFFNKPCDAATLAGGIDAGLRQYALVMAENALLEQTLAGSVKVLCDVLSLRDPALFGRALRVKEWAERLAAHLDMPQPWQVGMAAMLAPIGLVAVPPELLAAADGASSEQATEIVAQAPETARRLIANIPRLEEVAEMVAYQARGFDGSGVPKAGARATDIPLGGRILKLLYDLEAQIDGDVPTPADFNALAAHKSRYDPWVFAQARACLEVFGPTDALPERAGEYNQTLAELKPADRLLSDIETRDGRLVLARGAVLTKLQIERLRNFDRLYRLIEPIRVTRQPSG